MIKHMPEGLTPFKDCGYARYPLFPMENEPFDVACFSDGMTPVLRWRVNGAPQPELAPIREKENRFRFSIGALPCGSEVVYSFCAGKEHTREYTAPVCREITLDRPLALFRDGDAVCASFALGLSLRLWADKTLNMRWSFSDAQAAGTPSESAALSLPDGFSLSIGLRPFFCELKRFSESVLAFSSVRVLLSAKDTPLRLSVNWRWAPGHVFGTGERFDAVDQLGRGTNGRVVEKFTMQGDQAYLPLPFFFTDKGFGWYRHGAIPAEMQFKDELSVTQQLGCREVLDEVFFGTPAEILRQWISRTGKPALPPEWSFGVWISANGWSNDQEVDAQLKAIKKYDYPASVMVLEAWSDERTFYRWNDNGSWKNPKETVGRIRRAGLHLMLWQIPIIKYEWEGEWGEALKSDEREAIERGYCVLNEDGTPYRITDYWFNNSLLPDFTNPDAVKWWFGKRKYLLDMGVEGFKTDGGEFLFDSTARLYNGMRGLEAHNLYPSQYVAAYHDFLQQNHVDGLTFSRAGYIGAQTQPAHWAGDQLSLWSELKSQLNAGLSAGLSGVIFWGFDIGGFAGELPTKELYLRATQMACFCPIMQWHAEPRTGQFYQSYGGSFVNDRSPWNLAEKLGDPEIITLAAAYAHMREKLRPYLYGEAQNCVREGRPMMAHLCIDFFEDARACQTEDEFMLGRALLVAPILKEGAAGREVYLPAGQWQDIWTGERFAGGRTYTAECGADRIPVYLRADRYARDILPAL